MTTTPTAVEQAHAEVVDLQAQLDAALADIPDAAVPGEAAMQQRARARVHLPDALLAASRRLLDARIAEHEQAVTAASAHAERAITEHAALSAALIALYEKRVEVATLQADAQRHRRQQVTALTS
jgi:hypothetical protein